MSDYKDLKEFISDYYDIISKKYPLIDKKTFLNEFNNTFLNDYIASGNSKIVFKNLIDKMYKENKISKLFLDKMIQILDTKDDYAKLIILTNEIENLQLTNFERNAIGVFKSTLQNSNKLWTTLTSRTAPPGSWTIIGDAVGAFVFCYIPPLAAVAGGAISLAVHNSNNP